MQGVTRLTSWGTIVSVKEFTYSREAFTEEKIRLGELLDYK